MIKKVSIEKVSEFLEKENGNYAKKLTSKQETRAPNQDVFKDSPKVQTQESAKVEETSNGVVNSNENQTEQ